MAKPFIDMIGLKYNRLTVVSKSDKAHTKGDTSSMWNCVCDCGSLLVVSRRSLLSDRIMSCGCLRLELNRKQAKDRRRPGIEAPLNRLYKRYKWNSEDRGFVFELTKEDFHNIIKMDCFYCGDEPSQKEKTIRNNDIEHILIYNGVDRINSNVGYNLDNCVPCCGVCNLMKQDLSVQSFYDKIQKIYRRKLNE